MSTGNYINIFFLHLSEKYVIHLTKPLPMLPIMISHEIVMIIEYWSNTHFFDNVTSIHSTFYH